MEELVITAVGPDRPGLVDELTGFLLNAGANVGDSRMINLRGQFAILLEAQVEGEAASRIRDEIDAIGERIGLRISVTNIGSTSRNEAGVPYELTTYAMDKPGIVHRITHLLHSRGVNIEELQTDLEPGSYASTPVFNMALRMTVPPSVQFSKLRDDIAELCDELNCSFSLDSA